MFNAVKKSWSSCQLAGVLLDNKDKGIAWETLFKNLNFILNIGI